MKVEQEKNTQSLTEEKKFNGNVFLFHAFDIGDDIALEKVRSAHNIIDRPLQLPKYFKNYHTPVKIELPHPHSSSKNKGVKLYSFGCASLTYQYPFEMSLNELIKEIDPIENQIREQSFEDANVLFKTIKQYVSKPYFFHTHACYLVIQLNHQAGVDGNLLKKMYGSKIASLLRFEKESLSEFQKSEILEASIGYFKGDLIVIDSESAFLYDQDYEDILMLFEFANIQQLELQYFDRTLDQQLNTIYEELDKPVSFTQYLPFFGIADSPVSKLGKLKVDISVITERLESSIKLSGEPFYFDLYALLEERLGLEHWQTSVEKKLAIISDIRSNMRHTVDSIREDLLTILIILLIFIELMVGILK